ncbi:MAG: DNA polymerase III subunit delta' [Pseudomonadota bacterium]
MSRDVEIPQADREGELAHPRAVYDLFGHAAAETSVAEAFKHGRLHHAWMITGPKGVGKATFAYRLVRRALGAKTKPGGGLQAEADDPVCRLLEAQSHPDFLLLRRAYDEKRGKLRGEITVDDARRAPGFFSKRASGDHWRVALVDAADDMNVNAANALLKTLEEPPEKGLLILIVHAPGRLPATIRSRCRKLVLRAPSVEDCAAWLKERWAMPGDTAERAAALAAGAPGRALALAETGAADLYDEMNAALGDLPRFDRKAATRLGDLVGAKGGDSRLEIILQFLAGFAQRQAIETANAASLEAAGSWAAAAEQIEQLGGEAQGLYLDPRQTVREGLAVLRRTAAQAAGR